MTHKKILIIGTGSIFAQEEMSEDKIREMVAIEMKRVEELEVEKRPPFIPIGMNIPHDMMSVATMILHETAKTGIPVVLCSPEQKIKLDELNLEGKGLEDLVANFKPEIKFELTNTRLPEFDKVQVLKAPTGDFFQGNKNTFGGHKKGKNRKLRRR